VRQRAAVGHTPVDAVFLRPAVRRCAMLKYAEGALEYMRGTAMRGAGRRGRGEARRRYVASGFCVYGVYAAQ